MTSATPQADLGTTLRAWRDRLPPSAAALPAGPARRAAGLRREELAELAGVSVDYVVRLEQGRAATPSPSVVAALARALQLTDAERDHLYRLARLAPPAPEVIRDRIPPGMHRVLGRLGDVAAAVFAADWRLLWWNPGWAGLLGDPSSTPPDRRNFALDRFLLGDGPARLAQWPVHEPDRAAVDAALVADLRRATGRFPRDARLAGLIGELAEGSARFAALWAGASVAAHKEDHKTIEHPQLGPVEVDCDVLTDGDTELKIVIMSAAPGSAAETGLRQAAGLGESESACVS
jgi:transcriptional regulator with XRE-family HTH domain